MRRNLAPTGSASASAAAASLVSRLLVQGYVGLAKKLRPQPRQIARARLASSARMPAGLLESRVASAR